MTSPRCRKPEFYADKVVLAPMVRANSLPFRLLCLSYGADLVYTEELIDYRLSRCRRLENRVLGTIDFVDEQGEIVLRTDPAERDRLILQIGSNNPDRAVRAAQLVANDVAGVDFNFGCPKSFSISGGMGAALLEKPNEIKSLLTRMVQSVDLPVTCKIRMLPELHRTLELVKMIEHCGVSAIAAHGRTKEQRPRHDNRDDMVAEIVKALQIPVLANGGSNDIKSYSDVVKFRDRTGSSSVMLGRCAMRNPSIFRRDNDLEPVENVIEQFLKLSVKYDTYVPNVKYNIQTMLASGHYGPDVLRAFHSAGDYSKLCDVFNLSEWYQSNKLSRPKAEYYGPEQLENRMLEKFISEKKASLSHIKEFVCDTLTYNQRVYGKSSPRAQLNDYVNQNRHLGLERPEIEVFRLEGQKKNQFYCFIVFQRVFYLNKLHSISKKGAEHATSMLICERLGLVQLDDYKSKISACNRNVA